MTYFAKPDEMAKLRASPEASVVTGESGLEYLHVPENVVNPDAQQRVCLLTGELRYRDVLVIPRADNGHIFAPPYER